jgi:glycosyltransferase involved in cell wall biosynthesis
MNDWWLWLIIGLFAAYWIRTLVICLIGYPQLQPLFPVLDERLHLASENKEATRAKTNEGMVTIIVAAKDEAENIEQTIRGLWAQSWSSIEWIVVNDRSTDRTGEILDQLQQEWDMKQPGDQRFHVQHIHTLPVGWLGKNHALHGAAQRARGEWILFTDADIQFHPDTIRTALDYVTQHQIDHLTLSPGFIARSFLLNGFVSLFLFSLNEVLRPWRANDDNRRTHGLGVGAFNLIRRQVYEAIGSHQAIALRPDDDLVLGAQIKAAGYRQRFLLGRDWIQVEWYPSLIAAIRGLEKNVFAGLGYNPLLALGMITGFLFQYHMTFWVLIYAIVVKPNDLPLVIAGAAVVMLQCGLIGWSSWRFTGRKPMELLVLPLTTFIVSYTLAHSVGLALWRGGVYWRGTFYSLHDLRKMKKEKGS